MSNLNISSFSNLFTLESLWLTIDVRDYALAFSFLSAFIFSCNLVSNLNSIKHFERIYAMQLRSTFSSVNINVLSHFLLILCLLLLGISFSGVFSVRGISEGFAPEEGSVWWYPVVFFLISLLPILFTRLAKGLTAIVAYPSFVAALGLITTIYLAAISGRRAILFSFMSVIYAWFLFEKPSDFVRRIGINRLFLALAASAILIPFALKLISFTQFIRSAAGDSSDPLAYFEQFIDFVQSGAVDDMVDENDQNLAARSLVLWPLAASIKMSILGLNDGYLGFQDLVNSFLNSLPGPIYPFKSSLFLAEDLLYRYFPFSDVDTADSPHLYAFASFGLLGLIIYPIAIAFVYFTFLYFLSIFSLTALPIIPAAISIAALIEFSVASYGELPTTALLRIFIVPAIFILAWKGLTFFWPSAKKKIRAF